MTFDIVRSEPPHEHAGRVGVKRFTYTGVKQVLSEDGPWNDDTVTYGYTNQLRTSLSL